MKLWVDDIRKEPDGWTRARSVTEAIRILDTMDVEEVSLDHDISMKVSVGSREAGYSAPRPFASNETFEPVARFIAKMAEGINRDWHGSFEDCQKEGILPYVTIHTANSVGAEKMARILRQLKPKISLSKPCNRFEDEA